MAGALTGMTRDATALTGLVKSTTTLTAVVTTAGEEQFWLLIRGNNKLLYRDNGNVLTRAA